MTPDPSRTGARDGFVGAPRDARPVSLQARTSGSGLKVVSAGSTSVQRSVDVVGLRTLCERRQTRARWLPRWAAEAILVLSGLRADNEYARPFRSMRAHSGACLAAVAWGRFSPRTTATRALPPAYIGQTPVVALVNHVIDVSDAARITSRLSAGSPGCLSRPGS